MVCFATPVIRYVELMEVPSTKEVKTCTCFVTVRQFIFFVFNRIRSIRKYLYNARRII